MYPFSIIKPVPNSDYFQPRPRIIRIHLLWPSSSKNLPHIHTRPDRIRANNTLMCRNHHDNARYLFSILRVPLIQYSLHLVYMLYNRTRRMKYFLGTVYTIGLLLETFAQAFIIAHLHKDERACIAEPAEPTLLIIFS